MTKENNGWGKYQKMVIGKLDSQNERLHELTDKVNTITVDLAKLQMELHIKSGFWGVLGGVATVLLYLAIHLLSP